VKRVFFTDFRNIIKILLFISVEKEFFLSELSLNIVTYRRYLLVLKKLRSVKILRKFVVNMNVLLPCFIVFQANL